MICRSERTAVEIHVPGIPRPGGSKRHIGRGILIDAGKHTKEWRAIVAFAGRDAMRSAEPMDGPLCVDVVFWMPRPKSHFTTGRNAGVLKPNAPSYHTSKPDATKLWRSTEDALTGIAWRDDSQITTQRIFKLYGCNPGALITIKQLNSQRVEGMAT